MSNETSGVEQALTGVGILMVIVIAVTLTVVGLSGTKFGFQVECFVRGGHITHVLGIDSCISPTRGLIDVRTDW